MAGTLEGRTIALAEGRQLEELAGMLEGEGAATLRYPMVSILDAPDAAPVVSWLRELIADRLDPVILMTGEALRRLLGFADREGIREDVLAALGRARILTRGPKPVRALREVGLAPTLTAQAPTTEGVLATLERESLTGKRVGYTLYGNERIAALEDYLVAKGATPCPVLPYVYAPATDADHVADLIERLARGEVDVLVITSTPQVTRLFEVAEETGRAGQLREGLRRTRVAAVGPVAADSLRARDVPIAICPEQGFVMKNLVQLIKRRLAADAGG